MNLAAVKVFERTFTSQLHYQGGQLHYQGDGLFMATNERGQVNGSRRGEGTRQSMTPLAGVILVLGAVQLLGYTYDLSGPSRGLRGDVLYNLQQYDALRLSLQALYKEHWLSDTTRELTSIRDVLQDAGKGASPYEVSSDIQVDREHIVSLCNPLSRSCVCHETWSNGSGLCAELSKVVAKRSRDSINKPLINLAVIGHDVGGRGGLYRCAQSVCAVREGVKGQGKADGVLTSCEDKAWTKAGSQELIVSGLGDGQSCDATQPIGSSGVDAWVGEAPRAGAGRHIFSSWVDGSTEAFALPGRPLGRRSPAILPSSFTAVQGREADLLALSHALPISSSDGGRVMEGGRVKEGDRHVARRRLACPASDIDQTIPEAARQKERRRLRLCALSQSPFLIVPATAPPSVKGEIYDALQMGCVPVLLSDGSSDVLSNMPLPHPSSVIRLRDFDSIEALGAHLRNLLETGLDEHLAWKHQPTVWDEAFLRSLAQQRGNLACRVCDYLAQRKEERLQKPLSIVGMVDKPPPPTVPTCVANVLQDGKFWEVKANGPGDRIRGVDQVYVVHYTRLPERRQHIMELMRKMGIGDGLIMASYDREELTEEDIECFWTPDPKYPMVSGQVSLAIKHFMAYYDMIQRGYDAILVLEDDVKFHSIRPDGFRKRLEGVMEKLPKDYSMMFIGGCHKIWPATGKSISKGLIETRTSVCGSGYIITRAAALEMLEALPFYQPVDWHMNRIKPAGNLTYYQMYPPLLAQGVKEFRQSTSVEA